MLYSLAIELLLHKLRKKLSGVCFPGCTSAVELSAYPDDVVIIPNKKCGINIALISQAILFLSKEEGRHGLAQLPSRVASFHFHFIQRKLFGPKDLVWRPLAHITVRLTGTAGLIVPDGFTSFDASDSSDVRLPSFYPGIFTVCKTLVKKRKEQSHSFYWLLRKLMVHGVRLLTLLGRVNSDRHVL